MRIGIDIRAIGKQRTGDEVYFFNLVKNLAVRDKKNEYFLFADRNPKKNKKLGDEIGKLELGKNFKIIFIDSPNRFCWNLWALPNYLKKNPVYPVRNIQSDSSNTHLTQISNGVDIFHTQYIAPFWLPKNIKLVLTIHDISFNFFPQYIKKSDLFFLKTLLPRSIKRAEKIITVSQNEREKIINFYKIPPEKVDFAYNGVDYEKFAKEFSKEEKEGIRQKYNLPQKFLLYVGTFQPRKNIPTLIKAFNIFSKKHNQKNLKLVLAGNKKARNFDKRIDKMIERYQLQGKIIFPGWIDEEDKPILLQSAQCFVFPSLYEGFGIPIVEAMAAGIPVISSNASCLPEVGKDVVLYADPQNAEEFSEKIQQVLTDETLRDDLIKRGQEIAKEYSWQKTAEKILAVYKSL